MPAPPLNGGRSYNQSRPMSATKVILAVVGVFSIAFAVYVAETYPKRKVHNLPRVYQDPLPYDLYALEPYISAETMDYHYNKHDYGYDKKLQTLVNNTDLAGLSLIEILERNETSPRLPDGVNNNAGQLANHNIFWQSMTPIASKQYPTGLSAALEKQIISNFKSFDAFAKEFQTKATALFGSGWMWVVYNHHLNVIEIITTQNGNYPSPASNFTPLFNCDVWEHSYYIDYRNKRDEFIKNFMNVINWEFASQQYHKII